jgi:hypothetical protein
MILPTSWELKLLNAGFFHEKHAITFSNLRASSLATPASVSARWYGRHPREIGGTSFDGGRGGFSTPAGSVDYPSKRIDLK